MSKHLAQDLERLHRSVLQMAGLVEASIYQAVKALQMRNRDLAHEVIDGDGAIDQLENDVLDECLTILARHQPVARDLRRISAVLLISTDLERMGDLAVGIAERARQLATPPHVPIPERISGMAQRVSAMVRQCLDSFVNQDSSAARAVIRMDEEVDRENDAIIGELVAGMKSHPDHIDAGMSLFSAVRNLERIADHATNVAEDVIYLVRGALVRHHPEELDED